MTSFVSYLRAEYRKRTLEHKWCIVITPGLVYRTVLGATWVICTVLHKAIYRLKDVIVMVRHTVKQRVILIDWCTIFRIFAGATIRVSSVPCSFSVRNSTSRVRPESSSDTDRGVRTISVYCARECTEASYASFRTRASGSRARRTQFFASGSKSWRILGKIDG